MGWSSWIYLGLGLGLGVGYSWLLGRWGSSPVTQAQTETTQDLPTLLELKSSQLAYQLAHEMGQFKAGFLVRTSHELRSPLNSMIGFHQLILSDLCDNPAEEREFVAQAQKAALKLVKLLDDILDVARIEHATNKLEIQPLHLARVLEEVYQLTHLLAANRNFRLQVSPPDSAIYVLADPRCLRQVLVRLVETSIAQMEEGNICISANTSPADGWVHIWLDVQLNASAWSQEAVDLLQSENATTCVPVADAVPSPGLTLMLYQTLLELMKGRLEVFPLPTNADQSPFTRIQLAIPLVMAETKT